MIDLDVVISPLAQLEESIKKERQRCKDAMNTAVKGVGYKLRLMMQEEIRAKAPGGKPFSPLSMIERKRRYAGRDTPLRPLAIPIRYYIPKNDPVEMHIGWTGPSISNSWKGIAERMQEGFTRSVSDKQREFFRMWGAALPEGSKYRKYFFLRPDTKTMKTPARPIIAPFWKKHESWAKKTVKEYFAIKMAGGKFP